MGDGALALMRGARVEQVAQDAVQLQSSFAPAAQIPWRRDGPIPAHRPKDLRAAIADDDPLRLCAIPAGRVFQTLGISALPSRPRRCEVAGSEDPGLESAAKSGPAAGSPPWRRGHRIAAGREIQRHDPGPAPFRMPDRRE